MPAGAASRYALGAGGVGAVRPAPTASLISGSRYALGARRTALRVEGAARLCVPGGTAAGCHRRLALRARRRWRGRCAPGRLHVFPPDNARVASWWMSLSKTSCDLRRSRGSVHKALRAPAECKGVGRGGLRHHHARACGGGTLACYRSMCSASRRGAPLQPERSALPPGQADPPHFERARGCTPLERGIMTRHDDLNVAS